MWGDSCSGDGGEVQEAPKSWPPLFCSSSRGGGCRTINPGRAGTRRKERQAPGSTHPMCEPTLGSSFPGVASWPCQEGLRDFNAAMQEEGKELSTGPCWEGHWGPFSPVSLLYAGETET